MIRELSIPNDWMSVVHSLENEKGLAIILGMPDVGKSTFAKYLTSNLTAKRIRVGLVDADIGQSFLGPPATIGLDLFDPEHIPALPDWEKILPHAFFFVGATSPEGHFPEHIIGVKRMAEAAIQAGSEVVIVDTTGLVTGEAGKELKRRKIELLLPRHIFAIQRGHEIEHILSLYKDKRNINVLRLSISEMARPRSKEERRIYRNRKFQEYFKNSEIRGLEVKGIGLKGHVINSQGDSIPIERAIFIKGLLIGLRDKMDDTLALGVINEFDRKKMILKMNTPTKETERIKAIQLGSVKLNPSFEEEQF